MAEAITYADLRFVKAPLKKSVSSRLGHDPETDEDEELTYENVQVPSVSGGPLSLASSAVGDKAGLHPEQPTASWSSVTSPAAGRLLAGRPACMQYLFLGLFFTSLLFGVAAICLGVRYSCCPMGWILNERSCFYISYTERSWGESQNYCQSLSSDLATFGDISYYLVTNHNSASKMLKQIKPPGSFWTNYSFAKWWQQAQGKRGTGYYSQSSSCFKVQSNWPKIQMDDCSSLLPCICEMTAFKHPDRDHFLP
ncbi:B-cell differentiation antigen CD72 isoform X4 [Mustela lutreola]|uniref:B-cell differentiation antigen CD72 isoform X4 n=1 Tax=Mustela lutreola TaxID=9666 RepID=UPI002797A631|nr:B-cell differentiation antigen CD72 isoform X4 [Mustela lutreola]